MGAGRHLMQITGIVTVGFSQNDLHLSCACCDRSKFCFQITPNQATNSTSSDPEVSPHTIAITITITVAITFTINYFCFYLHRLINPLQR